MAAIGPDIAIGKHDFVYLEDCFRICWQRRIGMPCSLRLFAGYELDAFPDRLPGFPRANREDHTFYRAMALVPDGSVQPPSPADIEIIDDNRA